MRFCSKCGSKVVQKTEHVWFCEDCSSHHYKNPCLGNALLLKNEKGQYLFTIRSSDPGKGMLDIPGGFVECGETIEESMIREAKEEVGVDLVNIRYIASYCDLYEFEGVTRHAIVPVFLSEISSNTKLTPNDDAQSLVWYYPHEIPFDTLAFDGMQKFLKAFLMDIDKIVL